MSEAKLLQNVPQQHSHHREMSVPVPGNAKVLLFSKAFH